MSRLAKLTKIEYVNSQAESLSDYIVNNKLLPNNVIYVRVNNLTQRWKVVTLNNQSQRILARHNFNDTTSSAMSASVDNYNIKNGIIYDKAINFEDIIIIEKITHLSEK